MKRVLALLLIVLVLSACSGGEQSIPRLDNPQNLLKPDIAFAVSPTPTLEITASNVATSTPLPSATPPPTRTSTLLPTSTQTASQTPTDTCVVEFDYGMNLALLSQINSERAAKGLGNFGLSTEMQEAAEKHLRDLICNHILGHIGSDGSSPEDRADLFNIDYIELEEIVLTESETLKGIEALLKDEEFLLMLSNPDYQFIGMAYANEYYAGKNGVFVLVFFH